MQVGRWAGMSWLKRYLAYHGNRDPRTLGREEIGLYLNHLALNREISPSTQSQALSALVFLYAKVLEQPVGEIEGLVAAKRPKRLPSVLTRTEVRAVIGAVKQGPFSLIVRLLYGTGMRLMKRVRLRIRDIDFGYSQIIVRNGKGLKDRVVALPQRCREALETQIRAALAFHSQDVEQGYGEVFLPDALARKYPNASREPQDDPRRPDSRLTIQRGDALDKQLQLISSTGATASTETAATAVDRRRQPRTH